MARVHGVPDTPPSEPRERLLRTAAGLFYREGITGVGVDRVLSEAGVTRATMYRHFDGKAGLVAAYLDQEDATLRGYFAGAQEAAASTDGDLVDLVIEGIATDATRYHDRGCPFINAAAEYPDPDSDVRRIVRRHRDWFRATLAAVLEAAGIPDPQQGAAAMVLLRDATLVGVYLDGPEAADAFRGAARTLLGRA
ncbi:MAG: TetR/AcrR family transcriptional regulator [Nocardioidaceae bacterium]|nr:TetR/AcrR family transcriptional regulator [Nocardioidaceae bacterium]